MKGIKISLVPFEFKKEIFVTLTDAIKKDLAKKGVKEEV